MKEKHTVVEETELWEGDEVEEEAEEQEDDHAEVPPTSAEAASSSDEEFEDALDYLFVEPEVDTLTTSLGSDGSGTSSRSSKKRKLADGHELKPSNTVRRVTRKITRTKRVVLNTRGITTDVGSVHGSRDRANRAARAHFVDLQRKFHPDPSIRTLTYSNGSFWQEEHKEMSERCDQVNQENECIQLEAEKFEVPTADDDVKMADGRSQQKSRVVKMKIEVWAQERRFKNPRNLL